MTQYHAYTPDCKIKEFISQEPVNIVCCLMVRKDSTQWTDYCWYANKASAEADQNYRKHDGYETRIVPVFKGPGVL